ncbi:VanZ family protein, partial [bacterium]|nr:VanZ family protein [bacterium]
MRFFDRFRDPLQGGAWPFVLFYVALVCTLTLSPFEFSFSQIHDKQETIRRLGFQSFFLHSKPGDLIANILLFLPFGAAVQRLFLRESGSERILPGLPRGKRANRNVVFPTDRRFPAACGGELQSAGGRKSRGLLQDMRSAGALSRQIENSRPRAADRHQSASFAWVVFAGFLFSLYIESAQFFLPRATSISDLMANTLGTAAGCGLARSRFWIPEGCRSLIYRSLLFRIAAPVCCAALTVFALLKPVFQNDASGWNDAFVLTLGNETTGDRPWYGELHGAALYDRALRDREVLRILREGFDGSGLAVRERLGAFAAIPFSEKGGDAAHAYGRPDVLLTGKRPFSWLHPSGVALQGGCFTAGGPLPGWTAAVKKSKQFSVEAAVRTASLDQKGPARIVTLSRGNAERNFTLAQDGSAVVFRVRTPAAGPNGSVVHARAESALSGGVH